jgi:hypothetical protein
MPETEWTEVIGAPNSNASGVAGAISHVGGHVYLCLGDFHIRIAMESAWDTGVFMPGDLGTAGERTWNYPHWYWVVDTNTRCRVAAEYDF